MLYIWGVMENEKLQVMPIAIGSEKLKTTNVFVVLCLSLFILHSSFFTLSAQVTGVGINYTGAGNNSSAMLDVTSTTSGFLLPRMTAAQMAAISNPDTSLMVFNTTTQCLMIYSVKSSSWQSVYCDSCSSYRSFIQDSNAAFNATSGNTLDSVTVSNNAVTLSPSQIYGNGSNGAFSPTYT